MIEKKRGSFTSRDLALVAGLTGLYLVYGYASGVTFGHALLELDLFFLISALFTILVSMTGKHWSATLLGTVNGLILLGEPNAPLAITLSLIPNGLVFDLALYTRDHMIDGLSRKRFVIAGALGNFAMAISGLAILQAVGFFQGKGLEFILATSVIALVTNPLVGAIGALFGTIVVKRIGERVRSPVNPLDQKRAFSEYNLSDNEPVTVPAPGFRTVIPSKDWPDSQQTFRPS